MPQLLQTTMNLPGVKSAEEWFRNLPRHWQGSDHLIDTIQLQKWIKLLQQDAFAAGRQQGMTEAAEIAVRHKLACYECCTFIGHSIEAARDAKK